MKKRGSGIQTISFSVIAIWSFWSCQTRETVAAGKLTWTVPDTSTLPNNEEGNQIRYGREIVVNTAKYFGPSGAIAKISNGMSCQNCHLEAGTKFWGNNFGAVYANYPKFKPRRGRKESLFEKINDCFQRSLNGKSLDTNTREMRAMYAYIQWLGKSVPKGITPDGCGIRNIPFMKEAADPNKGKTVFITRCVICHQERGQGLLYSGKPGYLYPPIWGKTSFNTGASLYRLTRLAGFIQDNMPPGSTYKHPQLTNEDAWNVAAFIASQERPIKDCPEDWPDPRHKAIDIPYGPYADKFSESQHKYGPFGPIIQSRRNLDDPGSQPAKQ